MSLKKSAKREIISNWKETRLSSCSLNLWSYLSVSFSNHVFTPIHHRLLAQVNTFWEITKRQLEDSRAEMRNKDREIEEAEERHAVEIKVQTDMCAMR